MINNYAVLDDDNVVTNVIVIANNNVTGMGKVARDETLDGIGIGDVYENPDFYRNGVRLTRLSEVSNDISTTEVNEKLDMIIEELHTLQPENLDTLNDAYQALNIILGGDI